MPATWEVKIESWVEASLGKKFKKSSRCCLTKQTGDMVVCACNTSCAVNINRRIIAQASPKHKCETLSQK
jgi:hypothetical protein